MSTDTGSGRAAVHETEARFRNSLAAAADAIKSARSVWLGTHVDPDGDAIGSLLGLGLLLHGELGKTVTLACQDEPPPEVDFLPGSGTITAIGPAGHDLAIALDAADRERLGSLVDARTWDALATIVLDHHESNPRYGDVNVVAPQCASTAEIVIRLAEQMELAIRNDAAVCLLTGIVTDTLGFRTSNTTSATLDCARRMMDCGASLSEVTQRVFSRRPLAHLRMVGRAVAKLNVDGPFGVVALSSADFREIGATPDHVRGLSSFLATAAELAAVALLRERSTGEIDISLRSKPGVDLVAAAVRLGGGGHPQAAGATIHGGLDDATQLVLATLRDCVQLTGTVWE